MDKPTCRLCGSKHYASEPHKFKGSDNNLSEPAPDNPKPQRDRKPTPTRKADRATESTNGNKAGGKVGPGDKSLRERETEYMRRWRERNRDRHREYMREYMRKRRKR